jgi:hypothetical protein
MCYKYLFLKNYDLDDLQFSEGRFEVSEVKTLGGARRRTVGGVGGVGCVDPFNVLHCRKFSNRFETGATKNRPAVKVLKLSFLLEEEHDSLDMANPSSLV